MPRPSKYGGERADVIVNALRRGSTRKTAYEAAGISHTLFSEWLRTVDGFAQAVAVAEASCLAAASDAVVNAFEGYDATSTATTVKTVLKPRKVVKPDGTVIEDWQRIKDTTVTTTTRREFHPNMAVEILKRRDRMGWGDKLDLEALIGQMTSAQLVEFFLQRWGGEELTDSQTKKAFARMGTDDLLTLIGQLPQPDDSVGAGIARNEHGDDAGTRDNGNRS